MSYVRRMVHCVTFSDKWHDFVSVTCDLSQSATSRFHHDPSKRHPSLQQRPNDVKTYIRIAGYRRHAGRERQAVQWSRYSSSPCTFPFPKFCLSRHHQWLGPSLRRVLTSGVVRQQSANCGHTFVQLIRRKRAVANCETGRRVKDGQ